MNLREKHGHTYKDPRHTDRCDAALLLAAGDQLMLALVGLHLRKPTEGEWECNGASGCDAAAAIALWKKVTDGR
jgi:hypothetical protein